nr:unnamed protein product [Callosobruchus analis]
MGNMITFKRARAQTRRDILDSQRRSWREYVSTVTKDSRTSEILNKVKAIQGRQLNRHIKYLRTSDGLVYDPERIADTLTQHFAQVSSSDYYTPEFRSSKGAREVPLDVFSEAPIPPVQYKGGPEGTYTEEAIHQTNPRGHASTGRKQQRSCHRDHAVNRARQMVISGSLHLKWCSGGMKALNPK